MSETRRNQKDRASKALAEGRLAEAVTLYRQIVDDDPSEVGALLKIGDVEKRLGDVKEAVEAYRRVARAYAADGFLLKAIAVCKMVITLDRHHTETQDMLASLYAQRRVTGPALGRIATMNLPVSVEPQPLSAIERATEPATTQPFPPAGSSELGRSALSVFWPSSSSTRPGLKERYSALPEVHPSADGPPIELAVPSKPSPRTGYGEAPDVARVHIPLFSELSREAFIELLVDMEMREMHPGDRVIREGDAGDSFFILASGKVRVERGRDTGDPVLLAYLTDGAFFGEMALLQEGARTASVIVEEESQIFEISKGLLAQITERYPYVARILRDFYKHRLLSTAMASHPLFRPFDAAARRRLIELFKSRPFEAGAILLEQGKPGTGLYLLLNGKLRVSKRVEDDEIFLGELSTGDMFGEMSLLTGEPTVASVSAVTDCFVLRMGKADFDRVILSNPEVLSLVAEVSNARTKMNDAILGYARPVAPVVLLV